MLIINCIFERVFSDFKWYRKFIGGKWIKVKRFWFFEKITNKYEEEVINK